MPTNFAIIRPLTTWDHLLGLFRKPKEGELFGDLNVTVTGWLENTEKESKELAEEIISNINSNQEDNLNIIWSDPTWKMRDGDIIQLNNNTQFIYTENGIIPVDNVVIYISHDIVFEDDYAEAREDFVELENWVSDEVISTLTLDFSYVETCKRNGGIYHRLRHFK